MAVKVSSYEKLLTDRLGHLLLIINCHLIVCLWYFLFAYDDMDLPCGVLRLQPKGGYGRHNGLVDLVFIICF
ncbi:hypothetical protein PR202_gb19862 [Eleusine coracana subsp. coracana]|uniref:Uncharacterized protein n=1 Tax=Eleusine coracana subsp. coracana TaxID=191504 RepID=A0AAV5F9Y8_ELECO|nr:hypothetical protein PR202_gb19862 [Eleusine coracana subsp. coracana]